MSAAPGRPKQARTAAREGEGLPIAGANVLLQVKDLVKRFGGLTATDHASLQARAEELARTIAGHAPLTLRVTKEAMRRLRLAARDVPGDDLVALCFTSRDFREGVDSFLARRPPAWTST